MSKSDGKVIRDVPNYTLYTWYTDHVYDDSVPKHYEGYEQHFQTISELKNSAKLDIKEERISNMADDRYEPGGVLDNVHIDPNDGSLVHTLGWVSEPKDKHYAVKDKDGNPVEMDWSDLSEYFNNPESGYFFIVRECFTEEGGPLSHIRIGKCMDWQMPDMYYKNSIDTEFNTIDECFDYIKDKYATSNRDQYVKCISDPYLLTDHSLRYDRNRAKDRVRKDCAAVGINYDRMMKTYDELGYLPDDTYSPDGIDITD